MSTITLSDRRKTLRSKLSELARTQAKERRELEKRHMRELNELVREESSIARLAAKTAPVKVSKTPRIVGTVITSDGRHVGLNAGQKRFFSKLRDDVTDVIPDSETMCENILSCIPCPLEPRLYRGDVNEVFFVRWNGDGLMYRFELTTDHLYWEMVPLEALHTMPKLAA